jgi:hypothetical protein
MKKSQGNPPGIIKSVITVMLIATFCSLAIRQNVEISSELLGNIIFSVITYFFTRITTDAKYKGWIPPPTNLQQRDDLNPDEIDELNG